MSDRFQSIRDALAMGPTPGPWDGDDNSVSRLWSNGTAGIREYIALPDDAEDSDPNPADMHWIAACDPDTIRELLRQRDEMAKALEPFAAVAEHDIGDDETDADIFLPMSRRNARARLITVGDMRKARAALASVKGEQA